MLVFCAILQGLSQENKDNMPKNLFPDDKVIATDSFDVHQDWEVPIPGFLIIACRRKIKSIAEFNEQEIEQFLPLLIKVRRALKEVLNIEHVYLFQAEDTRHELFHLWIFPRYPWMEKFGPRIQSVRPIIEYAQVNMTDEESIRKVKDAVAKVREKINEL